MEGEDWPEPGEGDLGPAPLRLLPATVLPVIGITGGLATGKSLVTALLQEQGAVTFSADEAARAVLDPGGRVLAEIARAFGPEVLLPEGRLDRALLGERVFRDPQARERLEQITHPPILSLLRAQIEAAASDLSAGAVIGVEVPLLYETHLQGWFDHIVVVAASETTRIARLRIRNGLSESQARNRLQTQWPLTAKIARADYVINNDGALSALKAAVEDLWNRLRPLPRQQAASRDLLT